MHELNIKAKCFKCTEGVCIRCYDRPAIDYKRMRLEQLEQARRLIIASVNLKKIDAEPGLIKLMQIERKIKGVMAYV